MSEKDIIERHVRLTEKHGEMGQGFCDCGNLGGLYGDKCSDCWGQIDRENEVNEIKKEVVGRKIIDVIKLEDDEIYFLLDNGKQIVLGDSEGYYMRCIIEDTKKDI